LPLSGSILTRPSEDTPICPEPDSTIPFADGREPLVPAQWPWVASGNFSLVAKLFRLERGKLSDLARTTGPHRDILIRRDALPMQSEGEEQ